MSDKNRDNRSDRSRRDEPVNEIRKQILDAAPMPAVQSAKSARQTDQSGEARPDQVPGHLGYNTTENLINVNPETEEF